MSPGRPVGSIHCDDASQMGSPLDETLGQKWAPGHPNVLSRSSAYRNFDSSRCLFRPRFPGYPPHCLQATITRPTVEGESDLGRGVSTTSKAGGRPEVAGWWSEPLLSTNKRYSVMVMRGELHCTGFQSQRSKKLIRYDPTASSLTPATPLRARHQGSAPSFPGARSMVSRVFGPMTRPACAPISR